MANQTDELTGKNVPGLDRAPVINFRVKGDVPDTVTALSLLEATLDQVIFRYEPDQTEVNEVSRLVATVHRDISRGIRSDDGWVALCALMAWLAFEDSVSPVSGTQVWHYVAWIRGVYLRLPQA